MPATEQTWRDLRWMHIVFGVSSFVMLVTTIWMLAADHTREWKSYQNTTTAVETFYLQGRIDEQKTAEHATALSSAEAELRRARSQMVDSKAVEAFEDEVKADAERRKASPFNFARVEPAMKALEPLVAAASEAREAAQQLRDKSRPLVEAAQAAENQLPPDPSATDRTAANEAVAKARAAVNEARAAEAKQIAAEDAAGEQRDRVLTILREALGQAKFREDDLAQKKKFRNADLTSVLSLQGIAIGEGQSEAKIQEFQDRIDIIRGDVDKLTAETDAAKSHRMRLDKILREQITKNESDANKLVTQAQADLKRLHITLEERASNVGKRILAMPILDAFDNSDLHVDQIWLPDMTINYNFSSVARFDRCTSCHRSIDKTAPGSPIEPAFVRQRPLMTLSLGTPDKTPEPQVDELTGESRPVTLQQVYGFDLAPHGIVRHDDVTIEGVWRETAAAVAGLQMGDVIVSIDGADLVDRKQAESYLLEQVEWNGKPVTLTVRRGLPHPYASHPRLDLFVGSLSPHKKEQMGCTICHDGQGSATAFKWSSHTPNTPVQATEWSRRLGWFDNHHWIFPMPPQRFIESNCLKCHHEVVELSPSNRFPEPPAPKLMDGFHLVQRFGCFGCHEINGFDGPSKRIGPDMRAEPNFFAFAQALLLNKTLNDQERAWAARLVHHPEDDGARQRLYEAIALDKQLANLNPETDKPEGKAHLDANAHKLGEGLKDIEIPGKMRKVGPSLRYVASKNDFEFLYSWIRKPSDFRPSTTMPQFFGLWQHLEGAGLEQSEKLEPVEIRAITEYLLKGSQPFEYLTPPEGVTAKPDVNRGKHQFQIRGCLACHSHVDFPGIKANQGPDLSRLGSKLNTDAGRQWLQSWLRDPSKYHVRTKMPNLKFEPYAVPATNAITREADPEAGELADPAAEIAAFLLSQEGWKPEGVPARDSLTQAEQDNLLDLSLQYLEKQYPRRQAENYLRDGIPADRASDVKGDDVALLGPTTDENRIAKQLDYVGRRSISKYGCSGCHDVPGFEDAKPIGTGLADWGRKDPSKLAFEQIGQYLSHHGVDGHKVHGDHQGEGHGLDINAFDADTGFFIEQLEHHNRTGFLWQKLRQPRSFDYMKTENKGYNERLRMPQFPFDAVQREQVMTFVLGLVAEPPAVKYIYQPQARQKAIIEGRQVLEKFNCGGCHTLQMDRWEFTYHPSDYDSPAQVIDFPFLETHFSPLEIEESLKIDRGGKRRAVLHGMPTYDETKGGPQVLDEDGQPIEPDDAESARFYSFVLWKPALINGEGWTPGIQNLQVRDQGLKKFNAWGGDLARYLFPFVIATEKLSNAQAKGSEAWGWLPPPLVNEGRKVQTDWLHDFLLDPYPIRPAVVLRMPKFNMTSDEAAKLSNYFAASDRAEYPYMYDPRMSLSHLKELDAQRPGRLTDALKIIVDNNYCIKCHRVGDFTPAGSVTAQAPNLDQVHRRLRPDFMRDWIANPKRILPYTGMPVNIPFKPDTPTLGGVSQELFHGTSLDQLDALVDFLLNYDQYSKQQVSIKPMIKPAAPTGPAAEPAAEETPKESAETEEKAEK